MTTKLPVPFDPNVTDDMIVAEIRDTLRAILIAHGYDAMARVADRLIETYGVPAMKAYARELKRERQYLRERLAQYRRNQRHDGKRVT